MSKYAVEVNPSDPDAKAQTTWVAELRAAHKEFEDFHERGTKILDTYSESKKTRRTRKFPLFNANVSILENALFARIPRPDVSRRFKDPDDQVGRVAALLAQRAMITELESNSEFKTAARAIIKDMLVPGAGIGWVRYVADVEHAVQLTEDEDEELAEQPDASPIIKDQQTPIEHVNWKDVRWSPCRTWNECRWIARRVFVTEEEAEERFPDKCEYLSFAEKTGEKRSDDSGVQNNIEPQAEIWEIWDKTSKKIYFICEACLVALDIQDDFLGLPEFFPTAAPLFANCTTSSLMGTADFTILQDQYNELNEVNSRISRLIKACRLAGVYDETQGAVKLLLDGAGETQMVPVKGFSQFAATGGLKGAMDLMDITTVAQVIKELNAQREAIKQQIYELTGISDIVRGASNPYETAAAQGMKAQASSIRLQGKQGDVAAYLTELMKIKAFLMLKFYEPQRLLERAGTLPQSDQQYIAPAMQLLQNELMTSFKLEISSDALQQPNWAREQQERSQTITSLSQLLQQAIPASKEVPELGPLFLHIIKWGIAGSPGAKDIEGVIEMGLQKALGAGQNPQPKPPTPEQQAHQHAQEQAQAANQLEQQKLKMAHDKQTAEIEHTTRKAEGDAAYKAAELQHEKDKLAFEREKLAMTERIETAKLSVKSSPTVVQGNNGMDEDSVVQAIASMQQQTMQAITALVNQEQAPAQVTIHRNESGDLVGIIH